MKSHCLSSIKNLLLLIAAFPLITASNIFVEGPPTTPAPIYISTPGTGSILTSPIQFEGWITCQEDQLMRIELLDNKNRVLARMLTNKSCNEAGRIHISEKIYFDAASTPIPARLTFSTQTKSDYIDALTTLEIALNDTQTQIERPGPDRSAIILERVQKIPLKQGFNISVSGWISPVNSSPLVFEVYTQTGTYIGSKQHTISGEIINGYAAFQVEIPTFIASGSVDAILTIRQMGLDIPGNILLQSFPISLDP